MLRFQVFTADRPRQPRLCSRAFCRFFLAIFCLFCLFACSCSCCVDCLIAQRTPPCTHLQPSSFAIPIYIYILFPHDRSSRSRTTLTRRLDGRGSRRLLTLCVFLYCFFLSQTGSWQKNDKNTQGDKRSKKAEAKQRLWNLMEMPHSTEEGQRDVQGGAWGLGDRRTLDQFIEFTAVSGSRETAPIAQKKQV